MKQFFKSAWAWILIAGALIYGILANRRSRRHVKAIEKAKQLEQDKTVSVEKAQAANERAKAELHKANAALAKGRAKVKEAEDNDKSIADRAVAINKRLRKR